MPSRRRPLRTLILHGLLGLLLALPLAAAVAGGGQSLPGGNPSAAPACLPADSGDPGAAPCGPAAPASQADPDGIAHGAGNPIDVLTGNKYQRDTDLPALPGVLAIEIVRHYNSAQAGTDAPLGLLGRGWRLSYETDLHVLGSRLHIVQADGTGLVFDRDPADTRRHLGTDPRRGVLERLPGPQARHRWHWPDGRTLDFDARGKLVQIALPSGEFLSLTRGPRGELMKVTDPQGRSLSFEYAPRDTPGFRGIVAITSPLGRFRYAHQNDPARPGLSNLAAVSHPGGGVRHYHYGADANETAPAWPHHLTGISLAEASGEDRPGAEAPVRRLSTYAYDAAGRAILSVRGTPRQHDESGKASPGTGVEQVELDFSTPGTTVLTNSLGERTTYRHTRIGGQPRLLEALGAGCARCGETDLRYAYDTRGRLIQLTRLDPAGQPRATTRIERDAAGRVVRESVRPYVGGKPLPARPIVRYAYAGDSPRPVLVARPSGVPGREHRLHLRYNAAGQLLQATETGFSPLDAAGEPASGAAQATPIERTTTYAYTRINGRSLLAEIDGPLPNGPEASPEDSDVTRLTWDGPGNFIVALERPGGGHVLEHDPATGQLLRVTDAHGVQTTLTHDLRARLVRVRHHGPGWAQPQEEHVRYDALGHPVEGSTPGLPGANWRQHWDEHGRLLWRASALGLLDTFAHDGEGRLIERGRHSRSMAQVTRYGYDALGREARPDAAAAHGPARLRDDFGRLVWRHDPDRGTTRHAFDAAGRLVGMTDARGNRARYDYDAQGRILRQAITDAAGHAQLTEWRYAGRQLAELIHPTQRERYTYDARGQRTARIVTLHTDGGEHTALTRYEHDVHGQLIATTLPDGSRLEYRRNGQGQVVALVRNPVRTAWLRGLGREQVIVHDLQRDLAGLSGYTTGNGIEARYQRSREGVLARIAHRHPRARPALAALPGISPAHAQDPAPPPAASALPGALGLPDDPQALIDHRYLWDAQGNLLHSRQRAGGAPLAQHSHAYDARDRLIASVRWHERDNALSEQAVWRYAYDRAQRRLLRQQTTTQAELAAGTRRSTYRPGSHRQQGIDYGADGLPIRIGPRRHDWDALGRLVSVSAHDGAQHREIARYTYDHRGLRNAKSVAGNTTHTLYDDARQPLAELDAQGRITRQYVWLADLPLALIDTPDGTPPAPAGESALTRLAGDLVRIAQSWLGHGDRLVWLHTNHLGAPEAATDARARVIWRADYAPFGAATVTARDRFTLNLRLPGQYFDLETGLHYNRARYYDPEQGQYLSPDPLGTPDGPNPYAYVAFNPLRYIDPDGLILFAFDGTDNSRDERELQRLGGASTNVARLWELYNDGPRNYVSGVGTRHYEDERTNYLGEAYTDILPNGLGPIPDRGGNFTGRERIERMWQYFIDEAEAMDDKAVMDIDIVGFSRGAAQAREFANRLVAASVLIDGARFFQYTAIDSASGQEVTRCQPVNMRFMGLFDTVLSTDLPLGAGYRLAIPGEFAYVAHAVALNEYRSQPYSWDVPGYPSNAAFWNGTRKPLPDDLHQGGFPLESIGASSRTPGQIRIERGFIGAHADIGGGYDEGENQLSFVALNWMVEQASLAGVKMDTARLPSVYSVANPVIHDQSNALRIGHPDDPDHPKVVPREVRTGDTTHTEWELLRAEDREVRGAVSGHAQRDMGFTDFGPEGRSLSNAETHGLIRYFERPVTGNPNDTWEALTGNQTGRVDIQEYMRWLCGNGYFKEGAAQCPAAEATP